MGNGKFEMGKCEVWSVKCGVWNAPLPTSRFRSAAPPPFGQTVTFLQKLVDDGVKAVLSPCQSTAFASSKLPFRPLKGQRLEGQRTTLRSQHPSTMLHRLVENFPKHVPWCLRKTFRHRKTPYASVFEKKTTTNRWLNRLFP